MLGTPFMLNLIFNFMVLSALSYTDLITWNHQIIPILAALAHYAEIISNLYLQDCLFVAKENIFQNYK